MGSSALATHSCSAGSVVAWSSGQLRIRTQITWFGVASSGHHGNQSCRSDRRFGRVALAAGLGGLPGGGTEQPRHAVPGRPGPEQALLPRCTGAGGLPRVRGCRSGVSAPSTTAWPQQGSASSGSQRGSRRAWSRCGSRIPTASQSCWWRSPLTTRCAATRDDP